MAVARRWRLPSLSLLLLLLPLSTSTPNPTLYLLNIQKDYVFPKKDALNATKTVSEQPAKDGGASSKDYSEGGSSRDVVVSAEDFSLQSTKQPKEGEIKDRCPKLRMFI
jgi:hypothetical protein